MYFKMIFNINGELLEFVLTKQFIEAFVRKPVARSHREPVRNTRCSR